MACGCNKKSTVKAQPITKGTLCPKCKSSMSYKMSFEKQSKRYIKLWECTNKSCKHTFRR